jgi:hypothetical protein
MDDSKVILNGNELTQEQFEEQKKKLEEQKGVSIVEVSDKNYKTKLYD